MRHSRYRGAGRAVHLTAGHPSRAKPDVQPPVQHHPASAGLVTNSMSSGMPAGRGVSDPGARQRQLPAGPGEVRVDLPWVGRPRPGFRGPAGGARCNGTVPRRSRWPSSCPRSWGPRDAAPGSIRCVERCRPGGCRVPHRRPSTPAPVAFGPRPADVSRTALVDRRTASF
jgi:hypothetical protein